jgi:hypothetical protein
MCKVILALAEDGRWLARIRIFVVIGGPWVQAGPCLSGEAR